MTILSRSRRRANVENGTPNPDARRDFFRRMGGLTLGALGVGLLTADEAWAAVEERANQFGITPGTLVDANGRPVEPSSSGPDPFVGEIMLVPYNFAPRGFAFCQGQLLPIMENTALFSLLGTIYGGDGRTTFGLPDLRGRYAMSAGTGPGLSPRNLGQKSGTEAVTPITSTNQGGGQAHNDMPPFLVLNYCIALTGVFPSRS